MNMYDFFTILINKASHWLAERQELIFSSNPRGNCRVDISEKNGTYYVNFNVWLRCLNKRRSNLFLSTLEKISWKTGRIRSYKPPFKYQTSCHLWVEGLKSKQYASNHVIPSGNYRNVIFVINYEISSKDFKEIAKHFEDFLSVSLIIKDSAGRLSRTHFQAKIYTIIDNQL